MSTTPATMSIPTETYTIILLDALDIYIYDT